MMRKNVLLFIYNSFGDPLFQNILLSYIKEIQQGKRQYTFHVITFEQQEYKIDIEKRKVIKGKLQSQGIFWYPLDFHTGRFILIKKFWDMCTAVVTVGKLRVRYNTQVIFAFANVSAAYSYLLSRLYRMKLMIYSYEPHSEFMAELGVWERKSLKYKLLKFLEEEAGKKASVVLTGTKYMVEELGRKRMDKNVYRAPTAVDEELFKFNDNARKLIRSQMNLEKCKVVLYIGKFGDLYYKEEVIEFFSGLFKKSPFYFFIVITRYPHTEVRSWFVKYGIPSNKYFITGNLTDQEVKDYISVADIGISAVPPSPSQKYRSPTKVGEYLMCGLPYITCQGVSEDDIYAQEYNVGIVVNEFSAAEAVGKFDSIDSLLNENKDEVRSRCRSIGIEYRSKKKVVGLIDYQLNQMYSTPD